MCIRDSLETYVDRARNAPERLVVLDDPVEREQGRRARSALSGSREQERLYRARLAIRLGLADDDIRAVFDLTINELTLLRGEVTAA